MVVEGRERKGTRRGHVSSFRRSYVCLAHTSGSLLPAIAWYAVRPFLSLMFLLAPRSSSQAHASQRLARAARKSGLRSSAPPRAST